MSQSMDIVQILKITPESRSTNLKNWLMVRQDTKTRQTNLSTTWTDYKKTWILEFLALYKTNSPLIAFIRNSSVIHLHWDSVKMNIHPTSQQIPIWNNKLVTGGNKCHWHQDQNTSKCSLSYPEVLWAMESERATISEWWSPRWVVPEKLKLENDEEDEEQLSCTAKPLHGISICTKEKWLLSRNPTSG